VSTLYLDASALVKRYSSEVGSAWVETHVAALSGHSLVTAEFTIVEVAAALAAKHRAPQGITAKERDDIMGDFLADCESRYQLISVDRFIVERAVGLTQNHRLRGYDAIHLATALTVNNILIERDLSSLIFVAADNDLLVAANLERLTTENPNEQS